MEIRDILSRNEPQTGYRPEDPVDGSRFDFPKSRTEFVPDGLPLEEPDMSYYEPLSFEEMAEALTHDVLRLNDYAAIQNRFSESYLDISRQLEKGISELASLCVTRAVFEKKGVRFTMLDDLKLDICAGIIRYHFRKSHDAAQKTEIQNQKFWKQMVDMETRWYHLAKRIEATGDRIGLIRSGKISVDSLIKDYERRKIRNAEGHPKREKPASTEAKALPPASAVSFPVIGEFLSGQPAAVSVQQSADGKDKPEEIFYPSMKARKKAERLARKQAREAAAANRKNMNSGTSRHAASHNEPEAIQDPFVPESGRNCGYKDPSSRHSARSFREPAAFSCEDYSPGGKKRGIPPERV
ncbi:MAG: hypothetical protein IKP86_07300 [Anaerolineaceae bacterium]|nr:hypothetical protein [Anaerolineaceae bacterium]